MNIGLGSYTMLKRKFNSMQEVAQLIQFNLEHEAIQFNAVNSLTHSPLQMPYGAV